MIGLSVLLFFMGSIFFNFKLLVLLSTCFFMLPPSTHVMPHRGSLAPRHRGRGRWC